MHSHILLCTWKKSSLHHSSEKITFFLSLSSIHFWKHSIFFCVFIYFAVNFSFLTEIRSNKLFCRQFLIISRPPTIFVKLKSVWIWLAVFLWFTSFYFIIDSDQYNFCFKYTIVFCLMVNLKSFNFKLKLKWKLPKRYFHFLNFNSNLALTELMEVFFVSNNISSFDFEWHVTESAVALFSSWGIFLLFSYDSFTSIKAKLIKTILQKDYRNNF